ncbi:multiple sugar transport system substrate-binding protein [Tessaracoccus bendigoensis DSM 12906]|uniref:Multiple sugar transport system substrate-binding protein n=1 Tax=Tessaracoccus bendigoensis DSM 12906 TaxID=1123357 RepID=A0A1M6DEQ2_9ACTN|nr:extracellular solute-binding protein [Tessaracoccus bendigoensis]SHI71712.1 multiple sugar transport system substrate-binding protein [Tessaracoccus bendigoensis DSM 12906]
MSVSFKTPLKVTALLSVAALGLTACGGTTTPSATESATAGSTATSASAPAEKVEIAYMHRLPDGEGMTKVADIVAKWNAENPNIQVTATKFDGKAQEMITKLETDVKANNAPCLAQLGYGEVPEMFVKGLVEDVTTEADKYKDQFGGAFGQMTVGGTTVGLPQDSGPLIYMYNEAEFEKLGLEVPTTAEELEAVAAKAAAGGKYAAVFTPDEAQNWLAGQAAGAGANWFSSENDQWKVDTTDAGTTAVATMWQNMLDAKSALVVNRWSEQWDAAILDGSIIGHVAAAWETGFALDTLDGTAFEGQWRVAQLPAINGSAMTGPDGGSGVAVMKGCEHPAEAMAFNAWFNTQVDDLASQGLVPAATAAATTPEKMSRQFGGQDVMAELVTANENTNAVNYIPGFSAVGPKMNEAAAAAGSGTGKVADVFTAAQDASIAALQDAGLPVAN